MSKKEKRSTKSNQNSSNKRSEIESKIPIKEELLNLQMRKSNEAFYARTIVSIRWLPSSTKPNLEGKNVKMTRQRNP